MGSTILSWGLKVKKRVKNQEIWPAKKVNVFDLMPTLHCSKVKKYRKTKKVIVVYILKKKTHKNVFKHHFYAGISGVGSCMNCKLLPWCRKFSNKKVLDWTVTALLNTRRRSHSFGVALGFGGWFWHLRNPWLRSMVSVFLHTPSPRIYPNQPLIDETTLFNGELWHCRHPNSKFTLERNTYKTFIVN